VSFGDALIHEGEVGEVLTQSCFEKRRKEGRDGETNTRGRIPRQQDEPDGL